MTIERFLGCAESAVLISGKPIRLQNEQPACDKRVTCKYIRLGIMSGQDRDSSQRLQLAKTCILQRQPSRLAALQGYITLRCTAVRTFDL